MNKASGKKTEKSSGSTLLIILLIIFLVLAGYAFSRAGVFSFGNAPELQPGRPEKASINAEGYLVQNIKTLKEHPALIPSPGPEEPSEGDGGNAPAENPNPPTGTVFMREYPEMISTLHVENLSGRDCCILMHLISLDRVIQKFYVRAGDTCDMPVSNGTYDIIAVIADSADALWFGPEKYFGVDGEEKLIGERIGIPWRETAEVSVK